MPRETIHYGRDYARVTVAETEDQSGYEYEVSPGEGRDRQEADGYKVTFSTKPHLDLLWNRTLPPTGPAIGAPEGNGSVQVSISLAPQDMQWRIDHIKEHPEDLDAFSTVFTETLSRSEINHFIRTLKRARDAAYGADE